MPTNESQIENKAPSAPAAADGQGRPFSLGRVIRLSTFQIGSAMTDIFTAGVWNRIMISDFNIPAWPVGLLLALRYFMAPVSLWIGHRSDTQSLWGWHRTSYVWLGRGLILLTFPVVGASTVLLEQDNGNPLAWAILVLSFLAYGLGTLISGSPYLALVRDSAPKAKQGIAIGIVETVLIAMFPVAAIGFGRLLTSYDPALFWRLILFVMVVGGFFWWFSAAGAERANRLYGVGPVESERIDLGGTFGRIWADGRTRRFFVFLFVATFSAWLQDNSETILNWGQRNVAEVLGQSEAADELYAAARFYLAEHPEMQNRRLLSDEAQGIYVMDDTSFAGISITLIDALSLGDRLDPIVRRQEFERPTLIINIDYAYGRQAKLIMQNLILLFGRQIRSVSVFGKSGAVVGQRGDFLLADQFIMQSTNAFYTIPNNDLSAGDLRSDRPVHHGTLLTVLGTIMQSNEMLRYYRTFWNVVGMEMEGSHYLRELHHARINGMLDPDIKLRFVYYTSDTPLEKDSSLATKLSPQEGVPAVYSITRAILNRVFAAGATAPE